MVANVSSCLPSKILQLLLGNSSNINPSLLPSEVFEVCTPTKGSREVIQVPHNKKCMSLDIISTAGIDTFSFSIDEHSLWVYAVDGNYIEPLMVDALTVANGDRYSAFIALRKQGGEYGIRVASLALAQLIAITDVLSYNSEPKQDHSHYQDVPDVTVLTSMPHTNEAGQPTSDEVIFFNQSMMVSFPPSYPQNVLNIDQILFMTLRNVSNSYSRALNSSLFQHAVFDDTSPPLLYQAPNPSSPGGNITIITKNNTWVDLIFVVPTLNQPPHPIHKHLNKAFIIGAGEGPFN